jgi:hypothetical protein
MGRRMDAKDAGGVRRPCLKKSWSASPAAAPDWRHSRQKNVGLARVEGAMGPLRCKD